MALVVIDVLLSFFNVLLFIVWPFGIARDKAMSTL
jgi:hypothetical protein